MALPLEARGPSPPRTLETLDAKLQEYKEDKVAKNHHNMIKEPLFKIPIDQVRDLSMKCKSINIAINTLYLISKVSITCARYA